MQHDPELQRTALATGTKSRALKTLKRWRWFAATVLLPSLLACVYWGVIASDVYVSESRFVIKAPDRQKTNASALGSLLQTTGLGSGAEQASEIIGYLRSRNALSDLNSRTNVREAFASSEADFFSRFPLLYQDDSFEALYEYYGSMVATQSDTETGLTVLRVQAHTAEDARTLNTGLLGLSEELVNRLNMRVNSQAIDEATERVDEAQARVRDARVQLGAYRNTARLLDPEQQGIGVLAVSNQLITQEAALRAQLAEIRNNAPNHPSIPALQDRIRGISQQVAQQTGRAVGTPDGIAAKITQYENLLVEQEFAEQTLAAASAALEKARVDAKQQQFYLERVVEPNLPDSAILPARMKSILAVMFACLCLYLVGWMLSVGVREHASED
ncbi:MAG: capsule biosynthesis protein [Pseudomonadota bacterium]